MLLESILIVGGCLVGVIPFAYLLLKALNILDNSLKR